MEIYETVHLQVQQPMGEWVTFLILHNCGDQEVNAELESLQMTHQASVRAIDAMTGRMINIF